MPTELINRPTLVLPEGTAAGDAQRLAQALDTHGVAGVLRQLDAVATLMQGLQEPAAPARMPGWKPNAERCGRPTRVGKPCRRHLPCSWHRPDGGDAVVADAKVVDTPAGEAELPPEPIADEPKVNVKQKPSRCPKCGASASSIYRERLPGGMSEWICRPCGWRKPIETPVPAAA